MRKALFAALLGGMALAAASPAAAAVDIDGTYEYSELIGEFGFIPKATLEETFGKMTAEVSGGELLFTMEGTPSGGSGAPLVLQAEGVTVPGLDVDGADQYSVDDPSTGTSVTFYFTDEDAYYDLSPMLAGMAPSDSGLYSVYHKTAGAQEQSGEPDLASLLPSILMGGQSDGAADDGAAQEDGSAAAEDGSGAAQQGAASPAGEDGAAASSYTEADIIGEWYDLYSMDKVVFNKGGKFDYSIPGYTTSGDWSLDGGTVRFSGYGMPQVGDLTIEDEDGVLSLHSADDTFCLMHFTEIPMPELSVGETISDDSVELTLLSADYLGEVPADFVSEFGYRPDSLADQAPSANGQVLIKLMYRVKNLSKSSIVLTDLIDHSFQIWIDYADGYIYNTVTPESPVYYTDGTVYRYNLANSASGNDLEVAPLQEKVITTCIRCPDVVAKEKEAGLRAVFVAAYGDEPLFAGYRLAGGEAEDASAGLTGEEQLEKITADIDGMEISEENLEGMLYVRSEVEALPEELKAQVAGNEKLSQAETLLTEIFNAKTDHLGELVDTAVAASKPEVMDGVGARRALSEACQVADEMVKFNLGFTAEDAAVIHEQYDKLDTICYPGTGLIKMDYVTGYSFTGEDKEPEKSSSKDEFEGCYHYSYLIDDAVYGGELGAHYNSFRDAYSAYLNGHFTYVDSGTTENGYDYDHYQDDMGNDIYLAYRYMRVQNENYNVSTGFILIHYDKAIEEQKLHDFQGASSGSSIRYAQEGDVVSLGRWEQDNNPENGAEPLKWIVLERKGDSVLVISEKLVDSMLYANELVDTTWETSAARAWLNGEFLTGAFTEGEQSVILTTEVETPANPYYGTDGGAVTSDRIFLPSAQELREWFPELESRLVQPTAYAQSRGVEPDDNGNGSCLLRTPGSNQTAVCVMARNNGYILGIGNLEADLKSAQGGAYVNGTGGGIRPCMWLSTVYDDAAIYVEPETEAAAAENEDGAAVEGADGAASDEAAAPAVNNVYSDTETVQRVQQALNEAGFDCGTPDGKAGNMTKAAVEGYQAANGLEVTGQIDDLLLESLGL